MTEPKPERISKQEAAALRSITRDRFKLLRAAMTSRRDEIKAMIADRIRGEMADTCSRFDRDARKVLDKYDRVQADALALVSRAADAGLELRDPYRFDSEGRSFLPQIQRTPTFRPKDLAKQVDAEIFEMMRETGAAAFSIDVEEIRILEELTVGQLETDAAREFLDKIPSVDQLLPLPAGAKRKEISA